MADYKNIVLCSDGTGNAGGKGRGTNVWRVFLAVDRHGHQQVDEHGKRECEQLAFYDDGVGTATTRWAALAGKAFGVGLSRNVRELYTTLVRTYESGDQLYLFGFSRGAFTIRSLAGMIHDIGVLPRAGDLEGSVLAAYRAYRRQVGRSPEAFRAKWQKEHDLEIHRPRIKFLGVWDTVGAVGVPFSGLKRKVVYPIASVVRAQHRHDLNSSLVHVRHALAIDECRMSFELEMFNERLIRSFKDSAARAAAESGEPAPKCLESVEQVWFAGVHSNVGGGMPKKGLERVSLHWMMCEAAAKGLRFDREAARQLLQGANVHSKLYDSRSGLSTYYRFRARDVESLCAQGGTDAKIHGTVLNRIERSTDGYAPINLPATFKVVDPLTGAVMDCAAADRNVEHNITRARRVNRWRELLYYPFLILSVVVALTLFSQQALREEKLQDGRLEAGKLRAGAEWLVDRAAALSESLDPYLGWTEPAFVWVGKLGQVLLPDLVAGPLGGLAELASLATIVLIIGWLMLVARRKLLDRSQTLGAERWRPAASARLSRTVDRPADSTGMSRPTASD